MTINKINYLKKIFEKFQNEHILVVDLDNYLYKDLTILEENSKSLSTFNTQDLEIWINTYKVKKPVIIHNHVSNNSNFSINIYSYLLFSTSKGKAKTAPTAVRAKGVAHTNGSPLLI